MDFYDTTKLNEGEIIIGNEAIKRIMYEPKDGYEYIIGYKNKIREEAYGLIVRNLWKVNTRGVDRELLIAIFSGISKNVFMTKNEFE